MNFVYEYVIRVKVQNRKCNLDIHVVEVVDVEVVVVVLVLVVDVVLVVGALVLSAA